MKLLIAGICLALLTAFAPTDVSARPPCGKVFVKGHYNRHGKWVRPHWKHLRWMPAHYDHRGRWVPGHCR